MRRTSFSEQGRENDSDDDYSLATGNGDTLWPNPATVVEIGDISRQC